MKSTLKKIASCLLNILEIYVPVLTFVSLFLIFIFQVFARYVLKLSVPWTMEFCSSMYMVTTLMGACYASRTHSHVQFTLLYDMLPKRVGEFLVLLGNLMIAAALSISFLPAVRYVQFMKVAYTASLKIPLNIVYVPYLVFLPLQVLHTLMDAWQNAKIAFNLGKPSEIVPAQKEVAQ